MLFFWHKLINTCWFGGAGVKKCLTFLLGYVIIKEKRIAHTQAPFYGLNERRSDYEQLYNWCASTEHTCGWNTSTIPSTSSSSNTWSGNHSYCM